ncbi:hypothetical protein [Pseudomonas serbica]|uniref:hypothetical protein n=1 Tax=Pseudomonas serbica TaxID=2965074 RepID=UPI0039E39A85
MNPIIKAVVFACLLLGFAACANDMAKMNAEESAAQLVLEHRNAVQQQFAQERHSMELYVDRTIERKIIQFKTGGKSEHIIQ